MMNNFNIECRKCRTQNCEISNQIEKTYEDNTPYLEIKCNECDEKETLWIEMKEDEE